jgi:hypothetical protein
MTKGRKLSIVKTTGVMGDIESYMSTRVVSSAFACWRVLGEPVFSSIIINLSLEKVSTSLYTNDERARDLKYIEVPER